MVMKKFNADTYEFEADIFYFELKKGKSVKQVDFNAECIAHLDKSGNILGIELDTEDLVLANSPTFQKMLKKALKEVRQGKTKE